MSLCLLHNFHLFLCTGLGARAVRHFSNELENWDLKNKEEKRENNGAFWLVGSLAWLLAGLRARARLIKAPARPHMQRLTQNKALNVKPRLDTKL
jgi:hypothetical protein